MATDFPHLLAQGQIGTLVLRNRIAVPAMGVSLAEADGRCGERIIGYHEEQARGGVGLIITGVAGVAWPVGGNQVNQIAISDDRFIPGLSALTAAVHRHGAKIAAQLHHGGPVAMLDMLEGRPLWAPSPPEPPGRDFSADFLADEIAAMRPMPHKVELKLMTRADIDAVTWQFAAAAVRAVKAGFDALEIHAGHGYLLQSFLSPASNKRTDAWGGTRENRQRFLLQVIAAVREAVGADFPLWCKLDSREAGRSGGLTIDDAISNAQAAVRAGVDAICVTAYHDTNQPQLHSGSHTPHVAGLNLPFAARIKTAVDVPVIASGRVEFDLAERAIADGQADFIAMGRKLLADPHLPRKLATGRAQQIRPCIYCYTCISEIYINGSTRCAVNPRTGFEHQRPPPPTRSPFKVVIVGGGPAGMEAARRLDRLGHQVTLLEQQAELGGTLRFAALAYAANEKLLDWLQDRIAASRVEVRLRTEASLELIRTLGPRQVIVATGALRILPPIPGVELAHVLSGEHLRQLMFGQSGADLKHRTGWLTRQGAALAAFTGLSRDLDFVRKATRRWMPLGRRIVIIGGELVGLELAEFLCERGRMVSVVDDQPRLGRGLQIVRRMRLVSELCGHGVGLHPGASDIEIKPDAVHFTAADGSPGRIPCDQVIVAKGACANPALADTLRSAGWPVQVIGDACGVGYLEGAIRGACDAVDRLAGTG